MSVFLIERYIKAAIDARLVWLKTERARFDEIFASSGLTADEQNNLWDYLHSSTNPLVLGYGYPNLAEQFPCTRIVLSSGNETHRFLGDEFMIDEALIGETEDVGRHVYGGIFREAYSIWVYSTNVDECYIWHKLIKILIYYARNNELKTNDILITDINTGEFNSMRQYGSNLPYGRSVTLNVTYKESVFKAVDSGGDVEIELGFFEPTPTDP